MEVFRQRRSKRRAVVQVERLQRIGNLALATALEVLAVFLGRRAVPVAAVRLFRNDLAYLLYIDLLSLGQVDEPLILAVRTNRFLRPALETARVLLAHLQKRIALIIFQLNFGCTL